MSPNIQLSLAEWSLHRSLLAGVLDHLDFPEKAKKDFGITAVEYVNRFFGGKEMDFKEAAKNEVYLKQLLQRSHDVGVINHLIMVDEEGSLAVPNDADRLIAVENHKKWIDAAKFIGCKSIRLNLHGEGDVADKKTAAIDSLGRLAEFARPMEINILVENHGQESSDASWLVDIMRQVDLRNVGTLPDFGNFCITHPWGSTQEDCEDAYDRYQGVQELLPYAKGISAKTYDFDANGDQPKIDYRRLMDIVNDSGFKGYIGVEYEGNAHTEDEGIRKTIRLIERNWNVT